MLQSDFSDLISSEICFTLLDSIPDTLLLVNASGTVEWANKNITLLGYTQESIVGIQVEALIPESSRNKHRQFRKTYAKDPMKRTMGEGKSLEVLTNSGETIEVNIQLTPISYNTRDCVFVVIREDSTLSKLKQRTDYLQVLLAESQSIARLGTWDWDIEHDTLQWSDGIYKIFKIEADKPPPTYQAFLDKVHPQDIHLIEDAFAQTLNNDIPYQVSHRIILKDGEIRHVTERGQLYKNIHNEPIRMIGTMQDVTEEHNKNVQLEQANQEIIKHQKALEKLAYYDSLTHLPNRNYFHIELNKKIEQCDTSSSGFAVFFMDLDGFKEINDSQGHEEGDKILVEVSRLLREISSERYTIARIGGDEFALICHSEDTEFISELANQIVTELPFQRSYGGFTFQVTTSIGIAVYPNDGNTVSELIKNADFAMYRAKGAGKNQFHFFEKSIAEKYVNYYQLKSDVEEAIEKDQFEIFYQPQVSLGDTQRHKFEALIRWHHPERGYIPPDTFISLCEDTGLITTVGEIVFRKVCAFIQFCRDKKQLSICVAVNLSVQQLKQPNLIELFNQIMEEYQVTPEEIELEVTETSVMENIELAKEMLGKFKQNGITISIDDFGTGYSSLSYLAKLPIDIIKIDRAFIQNLPSSKENSEICSAMISLSHALGKKVVAEGVETEQELEFLKHIHCDTAQGYLFSKPLPVDDILEYMKCSDQQ